MNVPIRTVHLLPVIDELLIGLLRSLSPEEWEKPTIARLWRVKDIAAHLLDGNLRTLSFSRDNYFGQVPGELHSYQGLVDYLNKLNADWVNAAKRLSPKVITDMLETTGKAYCGHLASLDPFGDAVFAVAWAGEERSANWFHIAREYTEKWIHQQQIREAVGKPGLMTKELFYPFIDTLMQALPYTYRDMQTGENTVVQITVTTDIGGDWFLARGQEGWALSPVADREPAAVAAIDPGIAWRLFSKGMTAAEAEDKVKISGDKALAKRVLSMVSVMA